MPVIITGDAELASSDLVSDGTGAASDPYVIEGWEFSGGYSGLCVRSTTQHLVIRDVYAHGNGVGIFLDNVTNVVIQDSLSCLNLQGWDYWGIYVSASSLVGVENCTVDYNIVGIYLKGSSDCSIVNNSLYSDTQGILLEDCDNVTLQSNAMDCSSSASISLYQCSTIDVIGNTVLPSIPDYYTLAGLAVSYSQEVNVSYNNFSYCVSGFQLVSSSNVTLYDNVFDNGTMYCLEMYSCSDVTVLVNDVLNVEGHAFYVNDSKRISFVDNAVSSWATEGLRNVVLDHSTECILSGNIMGEGYQGIGMWGNSPEHFASHTIHDDNLWCGLPVAYYRDLDSWIVTAEAASQIILANCTKALIEDIQYTCLSIGLYFVTNATIEGCILDSSFTSCVEAFFCSDVRFDNNSFTSDGWAIWLHSCMNLEVESCAINGGFTAANVQFSFNVSIIGNLISGMSEAWGSRTGDGVYSRSTTDLHVAGNIIYSCLHGVLASISTNITMNGNEILSCGIGVSLESVDDGDTLVTSNNITDSEWYGMSLRRCSGVCTYHNNFMDNSVHAVDELGTDNSWDNGYPGGGNYWSGYDMSDEYYGANQDEPGADGIGDEEYIGDGFVDRYPFTYPYGVNAPPVGVLCVTPASGTLQTVFEVDASHSGDREDPPSSVEVRFDWESDGIWDTEWTTEKTAVHQYSMPGDYSLRLEVVDTGLLTNLTTIQVEVIDDGKPSTSAQLSGTLGENGWYLSEVEVELEAYDDWSDIDCTQFRIGGSEWEEYSVPFEISDDGIHALECFSEDGAGNIEDIQSTQVKIDCTAPLLDITTENGTAFDTDAVNISLTCSDPCSGVDCVEYSLDDGAYIVCESETCVQLSSLSNGTHQLSVRIHDQAGNEAALELTFEVSIAADDDDGDEDTPADTGSYWLTVGAAMAVVAAVCVVAVFAMKRRGRKPPE